MLPQGNNGWQRVKRARDQYLSPCVEIPFYINVEQKGLLGAHLLATGLARMRNARWSAAREQEEPSDVGVSVRVQIAPEELKKKEREEETK